MKAKSEKIELTVSFPFFGDLVTDSLVSESAYLRRKQTKDEVPESGKKLIPAEIFNE